MNIEKCIEFTDYLSLSKDVTDKVGFLTLVFKRLHSKAPKEDFVNLGGRIAQLWTLTNKDTGYLLEVIWISSARACNGSHLNYIQAIIQKKTTDKLREKQYQHSVNPPLKRAN